MDSSQKADRAFVIASGKRTIVFQFREEVFNQMACLIEVRIIGAWLASIRFGGNNNRHLRLLQHVKDALLGIIRGIREQGLDVRHQIGEQRIRASEVRGVARREMKAGRIAQGITGRMEFGTQTPSGAAQAFCLWVPPFAPAAC